MKPYLIGLSGPTACGKTFVVESLERIFKEKIVFISEDRYYKSDNNGKLSNFDEPRAFDNKLLANDLKTLKSGKAVFLPEYNFKTHISQPKKLKVEPAPIIVAEGILIFYDSALRRLFDLKVFLDADADIRLARRLVRDLKERGETTKTLFSSIDKYLNKVKPTQEKYVLPLKKYADLALNTNRGSGQAVEILKKKIDSL